MIGCPCALHPNPVVQAVITATLFVGVFHIKRRRIAFPFSDTNLKETPLREALASKLLAAIREEPHSLDASSGGCALFDKEA